MTERRHENQLDGGMVAELGASWYVANTKPFKEFEAARQLAQQGYDSCVPWLWKTVRHGRKFRNTRAALFPSYIFVRLDLERQRWRPVANTIGIRGLIMAAERPRPVPDRIMDNLLACTEADGRIGVSAAFVAGQSVKIVLGPFSGSIGEFVELTPEKRVRILLDLLGAKVLVTVQHEGIIAAD